MEKEFVSVILPYRNAEDTLSEAVNSILAQDYEHFELILIDNASTDQSAVIASDFATKNGKIIRLEELRVGVVHAHNRGLSIAKGDFIARMDADDVAHPERLKKQVDFMVSNPEVGLVGATVEFKSELAKHAGIESYVTWSNSLVAQSDILNNRFVELPIVNPTFFIRRSVVNEFGSYKHGDFPEDYEFLLNLISCNVKVAKIDRPLLTWNDLPNRLTRTDKRYDHMAFFEMKASYLVNYLRQEGKLENPIWIWGAGKLAKRKTTLLTELGVEIAGYIDIDQKKVGPNCIFFEDIRKENQSFILSLVSNRNKGPEIRDFLVKKDFVEMRDFVLAG